MRRILKYKVATAPSVIETEDIPVFRSVGGQGTNVVVWVEATPGTGWRTPVMGLMTGQAAPEGEQWTFVGTTQLHLEIEIVVHVYHGITEPA